MKLIFYFFPLFILSQNLDLSSLFERAVINKYSCDTLVDYCSEERNLKQTAYLGAGLMLKAKHTNSPFSKYSFFKKGSGKLDDVIKKSPNFAEFRWLRYCLQKNAPKFLNYNKNLLEDKVFIEKNGTSQQKRVLSEIL